MRLTPLVAAGGLVLGLGLAPAATAAEPDPCLIILGADAATIMGTPGNDTLVGTSGPDVILGGAGNDTISGLGGDDLICGGAGNDTINAGDGNDFVIGDT